MASQAAVGAAAHLQQCVQLLDVLTHVGVVFDEVFVGFEVHHVHRIEPAAAAAPPFREVPLALTQHHSAWPCATEDLLCIATS